MPVTVVLVGRLYSAQILEQLPVQACSVVDLSHEFLEMPGRWFGENTVNSFYSFDVKTEGLTCSKGY
jgi:hypothetical protein